MKKFKKILITNPERFLSKISIETSGCWVHGGSRDSDGYVVFKDKTQYKTHRYSYAMFNGDLDTSLVIDHMCRNRACCNPDHLRAVTPTINATENRSSMLIDFCKKGHKLTTENKSRHLIYGKYVTVCKQCQRDKNKRLRDNQSTRGARLARNKELRLLNIDKIRERDRLAKRKSYAAKKAPNNG